MQLESLEVVDNDFESAIYGEKEEFNKSIKDYFGKC